MKMELCDSYGRKINYLRISLTDRCNFNCVYCRNGRVEFLKREDILTLEEIEFLALFFYERFGVEKIRLTGGEPLMRRGVEKLIKNLAGKNLKVKITTNGFFLNRFTKFLSEYGIGVNVSLDTLDPEKFKKINGLDGFSEVIEGIDKAIHDGVKLKINSVILRGINDDEILNLLDFACLRNVEIRFIEFMPFTDVWNIYFVPEDEIKARIQERFKIEFLEFKGTASIYTFGNGCRVGFISTVTKPFCTSCSRLRLTADGRLVLCMFDKTSYSVKEFLRPYVRECELFEFILETIKKKPRGFVELAEKKAKFEMIKLGG